MPNAYFDKWRSTSRTHAMGYSDKSRRSARRGVTVEGLTNDGTQLDQAITQILADHGGTGDDRYHDEDTDLPLSTIEVQHFGGTKAIGTLNYRRVLKAVDLTVAAKTQASRTGGSWSFRWWRDTTSFDSDARPNGGYIFEPHSDAVPEGMRRPQPYTFKMGITTITMTTLLDTRPSATWNTYAYQINSNADAQWLDIGAFPAKSLLWLPHKDRYVDGRYLVQWSVAYNPRKWQYYATPYWDAAAENWTDAGIVDAFPSITFPTVPVHTP